MMALGSCATLGGKLRLGLLAAVLIGFCALAWGFASRADAYVYWANSSTGTIGRANLDGTGVNQNFITGANVPLGLAVDGSHVYWANEQSNTIGRANLDGTGVNQSFITGASLPIGLTVSGAYIYWTNTSSSYIARANLDGSGVNQHFIYTGSASTLEAVAVNATSVFWIAWQNLEIGRANLDGSNPNENFIRGGFCGPYGLAVDNAQHLYWADKRSTDYCDVYTSQGAIARADLNTAYQSRKILLYASNPMRLAIDSTHLYWSNGAGSIGRANLDGSGATPNFITGASGSDGVAVDAGGPVVGRHPPPLAPQLTNVTQSAKRWREGSALPRYATAKPPVGTTFALTLDLRAQVQFAFTQNVTGRRVGGKCVAVTKKNSGKERCRGVLVATLRHQGNIGKNSLRFEGRINRRRSLAPGPYTLKITATANGKKSRPAILRFTILP